ncbi:response regulator transcription factor [Persicitalea sp.]|uniref:response regulator transcription factor n=1 Tax=Persicitalea sp. TaxID=3100273 RepID=UPI003592F66F
MNPLKILVVEDEILIANDIRADLERAGPRVVGIARDAAEALKLVKQYPPELALIDISLGKNRDGGIKLAQDLLAQHWMPFIYLTGRADAATIEKAEATLPAAYLLKPYRVQELLAQVALARANFLPSDSAVPAHSDELLFIPLNKGHDQIVIRDVLYLEAKGSCVNIYLASQKKPIMLGTNLGSLIKYFTAPGFYKLSRSLFINLNHLKRIEHNAIHLGDERLLVKISEANRKELLKRIQVVKTK